MDAETVRRGEALAALIADEIEGWDLGEEVGVEFFEPVASWRALLASHREAVEALKAIIARTENEEDVYDFGRGAVEAVAAMRQIAVDALQELEKK